MSVDLKLGQPGYEVNLPLRSRTFEEAEVEVGKGMRTASGRLVTDIIAVKKKFTITYGLLKDSELKALKDLYDLKRSLNFVVANKDGTQRAYTVRMLPISSRQRLVIDDDWYWQGVKVELEEI